ncbi:hypothetical protein GCM10022197_07810 [Microlunatus spumicola]|uniref:Uncharacterized protein n=1 Tax=Microlunatus spumicola TaxID=81499 RepID=A0ABP6WQX1_9ACTN
MHRDAPRLAGLSVEGATALVSVHGSSRPPADGSLGVALRVRHTLLASAHRAGIGTPCTVCRLKDVVPTEERCADHVAERRRRRLADPGTAPQLCASAPDCGTEDVGKAPMRNNCFAATLGGANRCRRSR